MSFESKDRKDIKDIKEVKREHQVTEIKKEYKTPAVPVTFSLKRTVLDWKSNGKRLVQVPVSGWERLDITASDLQRLDSTGRLVLSSGFEAQPARVLRLSYCLSDVWAGVRSLLQPGIRILLVEDQTVDMQLLRAAIRVIGKSLEYLWLDIPSMAGLDEKQRQSLNLSGQLTVYVRGQTIPNQPFDLDPGRHIHTMSFRRGTRFYHGGGGLVMMQCFSAHVRPLIVDHIHRLQTSAIPSPAADSDAYQLWKKSVVRALSLCENYIHRLEQGHVTERLWNEQTLFAFAVTTAAQSKIVGHRITPFIREIISSEIKTRPYLSGRLQAYIELTETIESLTDDKTTLIDELMAVRRRPSMRLHEIFVADKATATVYSERFEDDMHEYVLDKDVDGFVHMSDMTTVESLMQPGFPFSDKRPFNEDAVALHTERIGIDVFRRLVISALVDRFVGASVKDLEREANKKHNEFRDKIALEFDWEPSVELRFGFDEGEEKIRSITRGDWPAYIEAIVRDMQQNQPKVWGFWTKKAEVKPTSEDAVKRVAQLILAKFPTHPYDTEEKPSSEYENWSYFMRSAAHELGDDDPEYEKFKRFKAAEYDKLLGFLHRHFKLQQSSETKVRDKFQSWGADYLSHLIPIYDRLSENWTKWFSVEIASPFGMWIYTHAPKFLGADSRDRWSSYEIDAMILYTLTTSDIWKQRRWNGWFADKPFHEVVFIQPWGIGNMTRLASKDLLSMNCTALFLGDIIQDEE